jgi:hypothetical protein
MRNLIKGILCLTALFGLSSCAHNLEEYVDNPRTILEDPLSVDYQQNLDELERRYLRKEITYVEYIEQKKQIDDTYAQKAQRRQEILDTGDQ